MRSARARRVLIAAVLVCAVDSACAVELGTLFNSPAERSRLDRLRRGEPTDRAGSPRVGPSQVTGFVKRSDGRSTVWVDGVPMQVATPKAGALLEPDSVRGYGARVDGALKIERKPAK